MSRSVLVDWGSSALRVWFDDDAGPSLLCADEEAGILHTERGGFEAALRARVGPLLGPGAEVWLSGMVTSRNGWVETPYLPTPVALTALGRHAVRHVLADGTVLHFLPGVAQHAPTPDVMRGEEVQVLGALGDEGSGLVVLPGTHAKWVRVERGVIAGLRTALTGELFALLCRHSIVGRLIPADTPAAEDAAAFMRGVTHALQGRAGGLLHDAFTARSAALLGQLAPEGIADYLSGLLIGHELHAGLAAEGHAITPVLVGAPALVERYRRAFAAAGVAAQIGPPDAAAAGLRRAAAKELQ